MYYLKCKHCNHLNEVKSEYLVVCGLCNRKLEDNYKDWKVKHPEKSFEDFQRADLPMTWGNHTIMKFLSYE